MKSVPVLIAGGGPVGMTLACELSRRGIACMLVERNATTTSYPKMDITNARSMELFRRLGVVDALRAAAVPVDNNFDVTWVTSLTGYELHRFRYPSVTEWRRLMREQNDGSMPGEAPMRVSQVEIEPVLQRQVLALPNVEARWGVAFEELVQDSDGVTVTLRNADGSAEQVRCRYLAGCDGGTSEVRHQLGIKLDGEARVMDRFLVHFRSDAREVLQHFGVSWHYQSPKGTLIAQNDRDIWTLQARFPQDTAPEEIDVGAMLREFAGRDFEHELLLTNRWWPHFLVAERYGEGRVLLAGDAAHQYVPTGGYGMNTGIADACDLGWKLAAVLRGFAGPGLLASYDAERRAVGRRNCDQARLHSRTRQRTAAVYHELLPDGTGDERTRQEAGRRIASIGNAENDSYGIEYGYCYADSPAVCAEPGAEAPSDPFRYEPSTVPGVRMPSTVFGDGTPLYDRLGLWFTLVCAGVEPSAVLIEAARKRSMPLEVLQLGDPDQIAVYGRRLLLVRPDQHIAWRGAVCDDAREADAIFTRVLGYA
jgi:2-polyprenyl-6-methoxyphenol hydroxylase-like FAD-dependent oxidoreductase